MVESGVQPVVGIMAKLAVDRIGLGLVILRIIILGLMAAYAVGPRILHVSLMTVGTLNDPGVSTRQYVTGGGMIECRWFPGACGVAGFAKHRDPCCHMVRIDCGSEGRGMAGIAVNRRSDVSLCMACGTIFSNVCTG